MISNYAPCQFCGGGIVHHHISCVRYHNDDGTSDMRTHVHPSFNVGERLLLRDEWLRCFNVPVEFRAIDDGVALVLLRGHLQRVPAASLHRLTAKSPY